MWTLPSSLALVLALCSQDPALRLPVLSGLSPVGEERIVTLELAWDGRLSHDSDALAETGRGRLNRVDRERVRARLMRLAEDLPKQEKAPAVGPSFVFADAALRLEADAFAPAERLLELMALSASAGVRIPRFEFAAAVVDEQQPRTHAPRGTAALTHVLKYALPVDSGVNLGAGEARPRVAVRLEVVRAGERVDAQGEPLADADAPFVYDSDRQLRFTLGERVYEEEAAFAAQAERLRPFASEARATIEIGPGITCGELLRTYALLHDVGLGRIGFLSI